MSKMKEKRGITLMALVITIIVLLILAGVTISTLTGENGIIGKANEAKDNTNLSQLKEQMMIDIIKVQEKNHGKVMQGDLETIAQKYGGTLSEDKKTIIIGDKEIAVSDIYDGIVEKEPTLADLVTAANYGDYVNYNVEIGLDNEGAEHKTDWRIFYKDNSNVFLIASDYVQNSKIPVSNGSGIRLEGMYSIYWSSLAMKYKGIADISEEVAMRYQLGWRAAHLSSVKDNARATAALLDTSAWDSFASGIEGAEAVGGPTIEMYTKSWNEKGYTKLYCDNSDSVGYYVGITSNPTETSVNMVTDTSGYNDTLYYPHQVYEGVGAADENCYGYWLASPSPTGSLYGEHVMCVIYKGWISSYDSIVTIRNNNRASRPVVWLPSEVVGTKDSDGVWQIH